MRVSVLLAVVCLSLNAASVAAQSTNGTISGRVSDSQGLPLPGVTVSATSPNLQGVRETVTSENGDYILTLLPSGTYRIIFELAGFQRQERSVGLAPTQVLPLQIELGVAAVTEAVQVVGRTADVLTQTSQVATNFDQTLLSNLPTQRDYRAVMLMAPAVHPTGPSGSFSVAGSMSFENLYMVNGVSVNENLRGQAQDLVIEDAIQETTVATAGVSAEFGRFGGGVVNIVSKSGGNQFTGSFRETMTNDNWRALVPKRTGDPFANDTKLDDVVPMHEYTIGGPVFKDRVWFFTAGRLQTNAINRQLVITNIPYVFTDKSRRYEGKVTYAVDANHRVQGAYTKINRDETNGTFNTTTSMDLASLYNRSLPEDLFTINYTGVITPSFFLEGRYSQRNLTFIGSGSTFTDIQKGTLLVDLAGRRYNAPTFCGVCTDEERDNQDIFVKGSYFKSTAGSGSHNLTFGFDSFNDVRLANNYQSGSNYRLINAPAILEGTNLIATFVNGTTQFQWNPIFVESQGTNFRTHSVFANDNWTVSDRITANVGLRWDRNDGVDSNGLLVANSSAFSPRIGVVWDPAGDQRWSITGSVAKYVAGLLNSIADQTSPAGNSDNYNFVYRGPSINTDPATRVSNEQAIQMAFDWFNANGGPNLPLTGSPSVRGVTPQVQESLDSPHVWEVLDRYQPPVRQSCRATRRLRLPRLRRLLRAADRYLDWLGRRQPLVRAGQRAGAVVRSGAPRERRGRPAQSPVHRRERAGAVPGRHETRLRRQLHDLPRVGERGRRDGAERSDRRRHERPRGGAQLPGVSRRVELSNRRSIGRSAPPVAPVAQRQSGGARSHAQPSAGARERRALQRIEPERGVRQRRRSPTVRREPGLSESA